MGAESLLASLFPPADVLAYLTRQRRRPEQGMRRVELVPGGFACWSYEDGRWTRRSVVGDRCAALAWWLGDPWLPDDPFVPPLGTPLPPATSPQSPQSPQSPSPPSPPSSATSPPVGTLPPSETPRPTETFPSAEASPPASAWTPARWEEAALALSFHIVMETGARPHDVGPESTETGAVVYQRLCERRAAAQIYWYEGRSRWEDMRASCPIRTDIPPMLRCAVLAEAVVLLSRRPYVHAYIGVDEAPAGVAPEAAQTLGKFGVPPEVYPLLLRRRGPGTEG